MLPLFQFDLMTSRGRVFSGQVQSLVVRGEAGFFGVWANHASMLSHLAAGKLKVTDDTGRDRYFQTEGGFFEVAKNRAVLLTRKTEELETS